MLLAWPAVAEPERGRSVVSLLDSRASDHEVAAQLKQGAPGGGDWLAMLFEVFKESRRDVQEDQKYWLDRLEERNEINDAIQDYMAEITEQARKLNDAVKNAGEDDKDEVRRKAAIERVESSLRRLEAKTAAVRNLPQPVRRKLASEAERERHLLARAGRVAQLRGIAPRQDGGDGLRRIPRPIDPPPE